MERYTDYLTIEMEHKVIVLIRFPSMSNLGWLETVWCKYCSTHAIKQEPNRLLYPDIRVVAK